MKKLILLCSIFVLLFSACNTNSENINPLNRKITKDNQQNEDRIIKSEQRINNIIQISKLSEKDKMWLNNHIVKVDDKFYSFSEDALRILKTIETADILKLYEDINPNYRFIFMKDNKTIARSIHNPIDERPYVISYWDKDKEAWPCDCRDRPNYQCFCYLNP